MSMKTLSYFKEYFKGLIYKGYMYKELLIQKRSGVSEEQYNTIPNAEALTKYKCYTGQVFNPHIALFLYY